MHRRLAQTTVAIPQVINLQCNGFALGVIRMLSAVHNVNNPAYNQDAAAAVEAGIARKHRASLPPSSHILDVTRQEHRPFFEPMTGSLGNHLIHRQPTTGFINVCTHVGYAETLRWAIATKHLVLACSAGFPLHVVLQNCLPLSAPLT
jgi:hypothetical protein